MKLQDILDQYHQDSAQASDIARNLNYALLGVVWILSKESIANLGDFKMPLIFIVVSLTADFLQYFLKGLMEKCHFDKQEEKATDAEGNIDEEYNAAPYPTYIKIVAQLFYYLKLGLTAIATIIIICKLAN
jgi:hypothetical protein